nr:MAG: hypothetical protein DIU61_17000 [Bacteroidota bacterium]
MRIVFLITAFAVSVTSLAQESSKLSPSEIWRAGLPPITRFTPTDYKAHAQNWDSVQDNNGII